jgi:hypothetical protein
VGQAGERERSTDDVSKTAIDDIETGRPAQLGIEPGGCLPFKRRDLYGLRLVALFLDATYLAVWPDGPKEDVLVAWGFTVSGERLLLSVVLGMR